MKSFAAVFMLSNLLSVDYLESLASENASRLLSMQVAEKNIEEHLNELNVKFHRQRQAAITSELLDVVTGFEAITGQHIERR